MVRRQRQTRARIYRAALDLFLSQGFDRTSISQISQAADIGKGTFFLYFPTKEAVLGHIGEQIVTDMAAVAGAHPGRPVRETLCEVLAAAGRWHDENRDLTVLRTRAGWCPRETNMSRLHETLAHLIGEGVRRGEFRPDLSVEQIVLAVSGAYFAMVIAWTLDEHPGPLAEQLPAMIDLVVRGLLP